MRAITDLVLSADNTAKDKVSENFSIGEFACSCCHAAFIDRDLLNKLQKFRSVINKPIRITSGYRCLLHNESIGGAKNSSHIYGHGVDCAIKVDNNMTWEMVAKIAEQCGFNGIGRGYRRGFIHLDNMHRSLTYWNY